MIVMRLNGAGDMCPMRWKGASALANLCHFSMDDLSYEYPDELKPRGRTIMQELSFQTWRGAKKRYPDVIPNQVSAYLNHELALIETVKYCGLFSDCF